MGFADDSPNAGENTPTVSPQSGNETVHQLETESQPATLKETDKGIALFASRVNSADFTPISLDTANTVVSRVLAANKKNWNVDIIAVPTFDALPDDVKNTTTKQYGEDEARGAAGITHT